MYKDVISGEDETELRIRTQEIREYQAGVNKHKIKKRRRQSGSRLNRYKRRRYAIDF